MAEAPSPTPDSSIPRHDVDQTPIAPTERFVNDHNRYELQQFVNDPTKLVRTKHESHFGRSGESIDARLERGKQLLDELATFGIGVPPTSFFRTTEAPRNISIVTDRIEGRRLYEMERHPAAGEPALIVELYQKLARYLRAKFDEAARTGQANVLTDLAVEKNYLHGSRLADSTPRWYLVDVDPYYERYVPADPKSPGLIALRQQTLNVWAQLDRAQRDGFDTAAELALLEPLPMEGRH